MNVEYTRLEYGHQLFSRRLAADEARRLPELHVLRCQVPWQLGNACLAFDFEEHVRSPRHLISDRAPKQHVKVFMCVITERLIGQR